MKKTAFLISVIAILAIAVAPAGAAKKKSLKLGDYKATGAVAFNFTLSKNTCNTAAGTIKKGYCFRAYGAPRVAMTCPSGAAMQGTLALPYNVIFPKSGKFKFTQTNYYANGGVFSTTAFNMTLKTNGRATGSIVHTEKTTYGAPEECSSGSLAFKAKR